MNFLDPSDISKDWHKYLKEEFQKEYMQKLDAFLYSEQKMGKRIFPQQKDIFNSLKYTALKDVKVVIVGQDPYHGEGQAHGLSFSVQKGVKIPPSLLNIYKEIQKEFDSSIPKNGYLKSWAQQGVLLLNTVLTVEATRPGSHQKKGWEQFTDKVIDILNKKSYNIVFILWGSHAQKKGKDIDNSKHLVLKGPHPSPLSAYRGFFGCDHFTKTNEYLERNMTIPIDWAIHENNE